MKTILIVEDSQVSVRLFTALLESPEYQLRVAGTGREALQACASALPDLVVLDLQLPEIDGFEVARRLKGDAKTRNIPILVVTAYGEGDASIECKSVGVDGFMSKPFSGVALREAVAAFCARAAR